MSDQAGRVATATETRATSAIVAITAVATRPTICRTWMNLGSSRRNPSGSMAAIIHLHNPSRLHVCTNPGLRFRERGSHGRGSGRLRRQSRSHRGLRADGGKDPLVEERVVALPVGEAQRGKVAACGVQVTDDLP